MSFPVRLSAPDGEGVFAIAKMRKNESRPRQSPTDSGSGLDEGAEGGQQLSGLARVLETVARLSPLRLIAHYLPQPPGPPGSKPPPPPPAATPPERCSPARRSGPPLRRSGSDSSRRSSLGSGPPRRSGDSPRPGTIATVDTPALPRTLHTTFSQLRKWESMAVS